MIDEKKVPCHNQNMQYPCILFDFDDTLFNTTAWSRQLLAIAQSYGVSEQLYNEAYLNVRHQYNFDRHVDEIQTLSSQYPNAKNINFTALLNNLESMLSLQNISPFVYSDSIEILHRAQKSTNQLVLFTKGWPAFQAQKVEASSLIHFFTKVLYTPIAKAEYLANFPQYQNGIFMNDKAEENEEIKHTYPHLQTVLVDHTTSQTVLVDIANELGFSEILK